MTRRFAYTINGRTSQELSTDGRETKLGSSLRRLDGDSLFAYSLWEQPEAVDWGRPMPRGWPHEYLQSAGTALAMSIELRRLENGEYRQYAIGRDERRSTEPDAVIVWGTGRRRLRVYADEVFAAADAIPVYLHYLHSVTVPDSHSLRLLDPAYDPGV